MRGVPHAGNAQGATGTQGVLVGLTAVQTRAASAEEASGPA